VTGYKSYVDWLRSAAFELLFMDALFDVSCTIRGARAMELAFGQTPVTWCASITSASYSLIEILRTQIV